MDGDELMYEQFNNSWLLYGRTLFSPAPLSLLLFPANHMVLLLYFVPSLVVVRPLCKPNNWQLFVGWFSSVKVTKRARATAKVEKDQEAEWVHWRCTKDLQVGWSCARRQKFCYGKSQFNSLSWWEKILLFCLLLPAVLSLPLPWASSGTRWINSTRRQKTTRGVKEEFVSQRDLNQPSKESVWARAGGEGRWYPQYVRAEGAAAWTNRKSLSLGWEDEWNGGTVHHHFPPTKDARSWLSTWRWHVATVLSVWC